VIILKTNNAFGQDTLGYMMLQHRRLWY